MHNAKTPFILYGGDYNPDQWDEATLNKDMQLFRQAGINLVTLPVFSWAKLEPSEGIYDFEWLDKILETLWNNKIYVCMATPTTAQPAWLSAKYPEVLPVDIAGRKRTHGMRVFFCVNSEKYKERAAAIAEEMAKRYQHYEGLAAWHVSNEYGTYCYCEHCQAEFRVWLKNRYGTIETLNEKWNSAFWGRIVYDFEEIMLPTELNDDYRFNPSIQLDYMRFVTDSTLKCYQNEAKILKKYTPELPVFSNISGFIKKLDQFKLVEHMDCAGWDNYPGPSDDISLPAFKHDIMRALKDGASYIITEQSPNQQNWQPYNKLKRPGELKTIAYQGLAHGADACLFFQMRQSVAGQEKFHGAVISHSGKSDSRIFQEISSLGAELKQLGNVFLEGRINASVGILFDWDNWWALELASGPTKDMDYLTQVHTYYKGFFDQNIPVDILKVTSDFSKYKIIAAPLLYMLKPNVAKHLEAFVQNGGILIATYMTGMVDENDRCVFGAYPGTLSTVLGIQVEEIDALCPEEHNQILPLPSFGTAAAPLTECESSFLCSLIETTTAQPIAQYGKDFYKGSPCITVNQFGKGEAYYIGTQPSQNFITDFMKLICEKAHVSPTLHTPDKVEVTIRQNEHATVYFIINHNDFQTEIDLMEHSFTDLFTQTARCGICSLEGREVLVLKALS